jgi:5-methylcytosine-specific restriction endonuclease McrA
VLVLNRCYLPVHVVSVRRAFILLYRDCAEIVHIEGGQYSSYDFPAWCEISAFRAAQRAALHEAGGDDWIRTVHFEIQAPRIVRLLTYDRLPRTVLRFNRRNLFARDGHRCQYCGRSLPTSQLSLDHVLPRSRGGPTTWENVVCSCLSCNTRKGGRTPQEAHMHLMTRPSQPQTNPLVAMKLGNPKYACWKSFLPAPATADVG